MRNTISFVFSVILGALVGSLLTGCASAPALTHGFVRTGVQGGVMLGVLKSPEAVPYLRAATQVVCQSAVGTNISPASVIAELEKSEAAKLKTPEAVIIVNLALGFYRAAWAEFGDDANNIPLLHTFLEATCEGMHDGLPPEGTPVRAFGATAKLPPHVK